MAVRIPRSSISSFVSGVMIGLDSEDKILGCGNGNQDVCVNWKYDVSDIIECIEVRYRSGPESL